MKTLHSLTDEFTSPLFRIMSVYNYSDPSKAQYLNNISSFHIGKGLILSVCHNLRLKFVPGVIEEDDFQKDILSKVKFENKNLLNKHYELKPDNKRYLTNIPNNPTQQQIFNKLLGLFQEIQFDTSFEKDYKSGRSKPYLIIQFKNNTFYNKDLTQIFAPQNSFHEPILNRYTFVLELELINAFYNVDISIYRITNTDQKIINSLPFIEVDTTLFDNLSKHEFFCLQSSPSSELGRMLNSAKIDGIADHWSNFSDRIHQNYLLDGKRYIFKNYFRFGSSGAPYIVYDREKEELYVNAIQSEACPIQMLINNSRDGNLEYTHALATPLSNIEDKLKTII